MSNMGSSTSYRRAEGETTEWEDIQRKYGNKLSTFKDDEEDKDVGAEEEDVVEETEEDRIEKADLKEVEDMEDDFDDDRALERLRQQRLAALRAKASRGRFGHVIRCTREDWVSEVTEASRQDDTWVVVHLADDREAGSVALEPHMNEIASRHPSTKFVRIQAQEAIPGYPTKNIPTVLIYRDGEVKANLVGLSHFGGSSRLGPDVLEWVIATTGAIKTDLVENPLEADNSDDEGPGQSKGGFVSHLHKSMAMKDFE